MIVTRCSGAFAMAGFGRLAGDGGDYELRSVRRPGARAAFHRHIGDENILPTLEAALARARALLPAASDAIRA